VKRRDFINHLEDNGCQLLREGKKHSIYNNPSNSRVSTVPRHNEILIFLVVKICKDLDIPSP
jgi:mRNA interferase HicA